MKKLTGKQKSQLESIRQKFGLIIPKNVAESLRDIEVITEVGDFTDEMWGWLYESVFDEENNNDTDKINYYMNRKIDIASLYILSQRLGVDLVEVVE